MEEGCKKIIRGINKTFEENSEKITNTYVFIYRNFLRFNVPYFLFLFLILFILNFNFRYLQVAISILNVSAYNISPRKQYSIMRTINFHSHPA